MAKTITVPDLGQRPVIRIVINNQEYRLTPGATVEVPDEIAATIDNIIALQPKESEPEPEPTPGPVLPEKGLIFEDYDEDGYPHSARFVGEWTELPSYYLSYFGGKTTSFGTKITHIDIPNDVSTIGLGAFEGAAKIKTVNLPNNDIVVNQNAFREMGKLSKITFNRNVTFNGYLGVQMYVFSYDTELREVIFGGNVNLLPQGVFALCRSVALYDFSHCTAIPPLFSVSSLGHASGCVISIPAALSDTTLGEGNGFESETNWCDLTDIVWEVVSDAEN